MSVPEGKRKPCRLDVLIKAKSLSAYTLQICSNSNTFPPEYWNIITAELCQLSKDIFTEAWTANNINVGKSADRWEQRKRLQLSAITKCYKLLTLIQIAQETFHLSKRRIDHWGNRLLEVRQLLKSWHYSDCNRYDNLLNK